MSPSEKIITQRGLQFEIAHRFSMSVLRRVYMAQCSEADAFVEENIHIFSRERKLLFRTAQRVEEETFSTDFFGNKISSFILGVPELWICDDVADDVTMLGVLMLVGFLKGQSEYIVGQVAEMFNDVKPLSLGFYPSICEAGFICLNNLSGTMVKKDFIRRILEFNLRVFGISMGDDEFLDSLNNQFKHQIITIGSF